MGSGTTDRVATEADIYRLLVSEKGRYFSAMEIFSAIRGKLPVGMSIEAIRGRGYALAFFTLTYLKPLAANGLIEMTNPTSPNSPQQSYRLTSKGYAAVA